MHEGVSSKKGQKGGLTVLLEGARFQDVDFLILHSFRHTRQLADADELSLCSNGWVDILQVCCEPGFMKIGPKFTISDIT